MKLNLLENRLLGLIMKKENNILALAAFFSGCCGLAYEVLYNRILSSIFGDTFSVSFTILFTFLLGIAAGYLLAHRLKRWLFAVEIFIGLYSISAVFLILQTESYASDRFLHILPVLYPLSIAYSIGFLLIPSVLIGISIPVLSRYMTMQKEEKPFDKTYLLYNLGAALTILLIEYAVLQNLSVSSAVFLVGCLNMAIGIVLFFLRDIYRGEKIHPLSLRLLSQKTIAALLVFSLVSASYQLLLLKMSTFVFGPFRENFSLTVFTAIIYISIGTFLHSRFSLRFRDLVRLALFFILMEMAFFKLSAFFLSYALARYGHILLLFRAIKILWISLWGLPLLVFGMGVPVLLKETSTEHIENSSGVILFYSSIGNTLGYAVMFFIIHPYLKYGAMFIALALFLFLASIILRSCSKKMFLKASALLLVALFLWDEKILFVSHRNFFHLSRLIRSYAEIEKIESFKAYNQTLAVVHEGKDKESFFINGYHSIQLKNYIEKIVGVIPKLIQKDAGSALVLGLGSGNTAGATSCVIRDLDVVEINKAIIDNQDRFAAYNNNIHKKDHVRIILDDGVSYMKKSRKKYDVIINTVTTPVYFSSSKLYTKDFFEIVKKRLSPRGVYYTWFDGRCGDDGAFILIKTLLSSFRHTGIISLRSSYFLLFASDSPFDVQEQGSPGLLSSLKTITASPYSIDLCILSRNIHNDNTDRLIQDKPIHTIDFPALEYSMARLGMTPPFTDVKKWIMTVTSFDQDPLSGKSLTPEDLEQKYLYYSLFVPFLSWKAQSSLPLTKDILIKEESLRAVKDSDKDRISPSFLKAYLANRREKKLDENEDLLQKETFEGKELFSFDLMIQKGLYGQCLLEIKPYLLKNYDQPFFHVLYGVCLIKTGKLEKGLHHLETALVLDPSFERIRIYTSYLYLKKARNEKKSSAHMAFFQDADPPLYLLQRIHFVNQLMKNPVDFTDNPWMDDLYIPEKHSSLLIPDYDFAFFDILRYFR
ncbi:MAG: hypothetical protein JW928_00510 [Candidatus Aureabacteria bacterium]|nr:hypothetical protein [Candidatus Auribacterota bacterium]